MPSLGTGYLWNSQRLNALTITDGAAASPYRGRVRADRWVGVSDVQVTGTTAATSWFAAGTGDGSPTTPANYLKSGRRLTARGKVFTASCAADSAPQVQIKVGSTVVATVSHAFTVAAGGSINIKVDVDAYIDDGGGLNVVGEARFLHPSTGEYVKLIAYYEASFDTTIARTIDMTIKPHTTGETWRRALAALEI